MLLITLTRVRNGRGLFHYRLNRLHFKNSLTAVPLFYILPPSPPFTKRLFLMANVSPFKALYYNNQTFKDLTSLVIPPYDNIPAGDEQKYLNRSPYNFSHVLLPKGENEDYSEANDLLKKWQEQHILKETSVPCYYLYQQSFEAYGKKHTRHTLMCAVELQPFSAGIVRPHENTYGQYKADRLQILRKTQCNLSHIFGMVDDDEGFLEKIF